MWIENFVDLIFNFCFVVVMVGWDDEILFMFVVDLLVLNRLNLVVEGSIFEGFFCVLNCLVICRGCFECCDWKRGICIFG